MTDPITASPDQPAPVPSRAERIRDEPRAARRAARQAGFTLVEVIVVLSIMGLIMSLVGPRVLGYLTESKAKTARIQVETLSSAVELFFIDNGRYPLDGEGLQALVSPPGGLASWNGPYLKGAAVPKDPWGRPYLYASPDRGRSFLITVTGQDREADPRARAPRPTLAPTGPALPGGGRQADLSRSDLSRSDPSGRAAE
ncbi:type II secretion system major pseudopilin GspG [Methylobacterium durans]|uniref:type II secretion system major pseudopilin GspG n=1 Tax=Methylobacterium durans TaxID=2202825 RepID=UPI002AFE1B01|nr:type II secretion system major pseudopilin GspG [Methylobacterium durans]MEA1835276.1 type II secretion system major pseudopilin GspG [Methylobacterium durans]